MVPFSGAFVAILVTSVVLILPAEVQTAVNKESEEEEQKMEAGLQIIQQSFTFTITGLDISRWIPSKIIFDMWRYYYYDYWWYELIDKTRF